MKQHQKQLATYISKTVQNEMISIIGTYIQVQEIKNGSGIFSVIADESCDYSNVEQMPLIIRFMNEKEEIQELFINDLH